MEDSHMTLPVKAVTVFNVHTLFSAAQINAANTYKRILRTK